ncbi:MAG TPA: ribosome biogenesis GTP-binding protein YihA/YsxC, partial [Archangium sp.]|nr:ribosome biogenesis GTP-binding protein YihA/YsxC [Archangium sp.]
MIKILDARFITTAVEPKGYPTSPAPEVAFVGRSNVGKSSMINALAGRRKLVRVSNTPGRTRALNVFDVDVERGTKRHTVRFADLPGYGFAKVSKTERAEWQKMITSYLEKRRDLKIVVSIIDAEVGPT